MDSHQKIAFSAVPIFDLRLTNDRCNIKCKYLICAHKWGMVGQPQPIGLVEYRFGCMPTTAFDAFTVPKRNFIQNVELNECWILLTVCAHMRACAYVTTDHANVQQRNSRFVYVIFYVAYFCQRLVNLAEVFMHTPKIECACVRASVAMCVMTIVLFASTNSYKFNWLVGR